MLGREQQSQLRSSISKCRMGSIAQGASLAWTAREAGHQISWHDTGWRWRVLASGWCYADAVRRERRSPVPAVAFGAFRTLLCARSCTPGAGTKTCMAVRRCCLEFCKGMPSPRPRTRFRGPKDCAAQSLQDWFGKCGDIALAYRTWRVGRRTGGPTGAACVRIPVLVPISRYRVQIIWRMTVMGGHRREAEKKAEGKTQPKQRAMMPAGLPTSWTAMSYDDTTQ
jgi:hypothetical protein